MYQEAFVRLELAETGKIIEKLNPDFDGSQFDPLEAVIMTQNIPFYPGFQLLDIADYSAVPALRRFVVYSKDRFQILDFTNVPIYKLNQELPIKLDEKNVADYVRFFFGHVRGPHGKFMLIESVDDINWKDDPPPAARKAIGKMITPLALKTTPSTGYEISACVVFKDSLFKRLIKIDPKGHISISGEELLVEDLPVLDDTFGH